MTNQQAIEVLQDMLLDYSYASHKAEVEEAVGMAVEALEEKANARNMVQDVGRVVDVINRQAVFNTVTEYRDQLCEIFGDENELIRIVDIVKHRLIALPPAQPDWNNHTVACMLAELFGDDCACNYFGIDEWLPGRCELLDSCPNPVGVACWEQYLKHKEGR